MCEEETFPPQMGLVVLEPVSGFLLLEQYAADRKAATWTQALQVALVGLNFAVIQGTGDEATALHRHVGQGPLAPWVAAAALSATAAPHGHPFDRFL